MLELEAVGGVRGQIFGSPECYANYEICFYCVYTAYILYMSILSPDFFQRFKEESYNLVVLTPGKCLLWLAFHLFVDIVPW